MNDRGVAFAAHGDDSDDKDGINLCTPKETFTMDRHANDVGARVTQPVNAGPRSTKMEHGW